MTHDGGKPRKASRHIVVLVMALLVFIAFAAAFFVQHRMPILLTQVVTAAAVSGGGGSGCLQKLQYRGSAWEQEWRAVTTQEAAETAGAICNATEVGGRVQSWLAGQATIPQALAAGKAGGGADPRVFSSVEWEDRCQPGAVVAAPIEPLVGHFRHPKAPHCNTSSDVDIMSKDYMVLSGLPPQVFRAAYPGRRLLMDCGASFFSESLGWFVDKYGALGVQFDEIWAWEMLVVNQTEWWAQVPPHIKPILHFYNVPMPADPNHPDHPVHVIRQHVQPGDFLALKLDIDAASVELPFMDAIQADAGLRGRIGEMFFEMHYDHADMRTWFQQTGAGVTYSDVLTRFTALRQLGLRLHYWP